jgi:hypothetical protein
MMTTLVLILVVHFMRKSYQTFGIIARSFKCDWGIRRDSYFFISV